jgi:DNA-binding LytR/AlgR family response regulator
LHIIVADDEVQFQKKIAGFLKLYLEKRKIEFTIDFYNTGREIIKLGSALSSVDVFFLDVNMDDIDGIKAAKKIREYSDDAIIVFVTAYLDYSIEGYKVNAIRYILKEKNGLQESLDECMGAILKQRYKKKTRKWFHVGDSSEDIEINKILYIESHLHKADIHLMNNAKEICTI